ncbi:MAG: SpoIVB peptidase S55 domain protein [Selenomonas sp.]|uniref:SpoIVB peptidase S55 domain-containing protein n=1 Tax=Selenomonas sp. TaxID=2053611 RepID=UPI0025D03234|nr:SpoIVB peptidase S55 domain-containing protein [Selenomonas sp.]MCI6100651.1 SpoIVB peptidase S55 domain protein [Selenomonas sp.]MCI6231277.1 SpoIVB peptidase S55 domain protein [Selenomonas sp.]
MHRYLKHVAALGIAAALWGSSFLSAYAMPEIWKTSEITPGMEGTAYTVVDHTGEIRDFHVDIIGTVDNGKGSTPMIMAKASGPVVEAAGGILQGMSGSPVYVDGKLVGAVAAGLKEMTPYTFFITPIENMLPLWSMPDTKNKTHIQTFDLKKYAADKEKEKKAQEAKDKKKDGKDSKAEEEAAEEAAEEVKESERVHHEEAMEDAIAAAIASLPQSADANAFNAFGSLHFDAPSYQPKTKLFVSGFTAPGMKFLHDTLGLPAETQLTSVGGASGAGTRYDAWLEPGSAVGVAVVCGDFTVGATGTVTATDGDRILAFGHPFLHKGNVNYFMTDATVVGTISGQSNGMKIANVGDIIGRISQDRETGIAGRIGEFPSVVPMKIRVKDEALGRDTTYAARIAYDEDYLPQLTAGLAYAAVSKTSDTLGESTATLGFKIRTNVAQKGVFDRKNMFYNTTDVGQVAIGELMQTMGVICADTDKEADIIDVQVDVDVAPGRKTASLVSAIPSKTTVRPGETVNIQTTIKPYRGAKETLSIPYTVPKAQRDGVLNLDVRGGGMVPVTPLMLLQQTTGVTVQDDSKTQTTADRLKSLAETGRNNEIIIAPGASAQPLSAREQKRLMRETAEAAKRAAEAEKKQHKITLLPDETNHQTPGQSKFETKYIIDNAIHTTLHVDHRAEQ